MIADWPAETERTPPNERKSQSRFSATLGSTTKELAQEMGRLDPDDWRAAIGNRHTKSNGLPRHNANPDDPGFVLRWSKDGEQFAVACDDYEQLRDNVREVLKWVHETRLRSDRPVKTADAEFAAARLPRADGAVVAEEPPHEVLDIAPDADDSVVEAAARAKKKEYHPDSGGSTEQFQRVVEAEEAMLDE